MGWLHRSWHPVYLFISLSLVVVPNVNLSSAYEPHNLQSIPIIILPSLRADLVCFHFRQRFDFLGQKKILCLDGGLSRDVPIIQKFRLGRLMG